MNTNNLFKIQKAINVLSTIEGNTLEDTENARAQYIIDECINNLNILYKANITRKE